MTDKYMIAAIVIAYIVKGLCGFANTLVFTSILSFQRNNINISPVEVLAGYPSNVIMPDSIHVTWSITWYGIIEDYR